MRDAAIEAANASLRAVGPHRTRPIRYVHAERIGDWRLKLYAIATHDGAVREELVQEALRRAPAIYPTGSHTDDRYGVGFIIAHDAMTACVTTYYWWQSLNELQRHILLGPKSDPRAMLSLEHPTIGSVWELEVIDFERRAWIAHVLANPDGPDVATYLAHHLDTDL